LNLINDILDLSKIEAGKMDLYLEEVDLKALVEEVRSIVAPLATSSGNRFDIVYPDDVGTFYTDRTKLKQSLLNLLGNGVDAMDSIVHRPKKISIRSKSQCPDSVLVEIRDYGAGLSDPDREDLPG